MQRYKRWKWALVVAAAILLGVGLTAMLLPATVMNILPILLGITLLTVGICELVYSIGIKEYTSSRPFKLIQGIVSVMVGLVLIIKLQVSVAFIGIVLGLWAMISAALKLVLAVRQHKEGFPFWGIVVDGALRGGVGLFMMFNPSGSLAAWTVLVGVIFALAGIGLLIWTIYISRHMRFFELH